MLQRATKLLRHLSRLRTDRRLLAALSKEDRDLIQTIRRRRLTYLPPGKLASLALACRAIEKSGLPGLFVEAGCALGGSSILIARTKSDSRPLRVYDVFGMIPPPTEEDTEEVHERYRIIVEGQSKGIDGDTYYGYEADLLEVVRSNLQEFGINLERQNVSLIQGLVQHTMKIDKPVAFAHVDVDWYEPVKTCLERLFPHLVEGGCIVLDDYHVWGGCRKATDEFLVKVRGQVELDDSAGSMKITRTGH